MRALDQQADYDNLQVLWCLTDEFIFPPQREHKINQETEKNLISPWEYNPQMQKSDNLCENPPYSAQRE